MRICPPSLRTEVVINHCTPQAHTHTHKLSLLHAHTHTWCADTFMPGIKETCKSQSLSLSVRIQRANAVIIISSSAMCSSPPDMMCVARCFVFVSHRISRFISILTPALAWHSLTCCDNPTNLRPICFV